MLEFEKRVDRYTKKIGASREGFKKGWNRFLEAEVTYEELTKIRGQFLVERLTEKGLAICSDSHPIEPGKDINDLTLEQLGVFPKEKMRLYFYKRGPFEDSSRLTVRLELLCPEHFPEDKKQTYGECWIDSEVKVNNGRIILLVNDADVTEWIIGYNLDVEQNGRRPFLVEKEIYRRLGIPDLPEEVKFHGVEYGEDR